MNSFIHSFTHSSDICGVPTMCHTLKAEGIMLKKPLQPSGPSLSPVPSQSSVMLFISIFIQCHSLLGNIFSPHYLFLHIFFKVCLVTPVEQPARVSGYRRCQRLTTGCSGKGKALISSFLPLPGSAQCSHFSCTWRALRKVCLNDWSADSLVCFLLDLPEAGDNVLLSPQMQPKRPILKDCLSWPFNL